MEKYENINGGFPPINLQEIKKDNRKNTPITKEGAIKERAFSANSLNNVNIQNIIKSKKENFIKSKDDTLDIIDSL